jgi:hypothetical protein
VGEKRIPGAEEAEGSSTMSISKTGFRNGFRSVGRAVPAMRRNESERISTGFLEGFPELSEMEFPGGSPPMERGTKRLSTLPEYSAPSGSGDIASGYV